MRVKKASIVSGLLDKNLFECYFLSTNTTSNVKELSENANTSSRIKYAVFFSNLYTKYKVSITIMNLILMYACAHHLIKHKETSILFFLLQLLEALGQFIEVDVVLFVVVAWCWCARNIGQVGWNVWQIGEIIVRIRCRCAWWHYSWFRLWLYRIQALQMKIHTHTHE